VHHEPDDLFVFVAGHGRARREDRLADAAVRVVEHLHLGDEVLDLLRGHDRLGHIDRPAGLVGSALPEFGALLQLGCGFDELRALAMISNTKKMRTSQREVWNWKWSSRRLTDSPYGVFGFLSPDSCSRWPAENWPGADRTAGACPVGVSGWYA
jgi:hypothetical protein